LLTGGQESGFRNQESGFSRNGGFGISPEEIRLARGRLPVEDDGNGAGLRDAEEDQEPLTVGRRLIAQIPPQGGQLKQLAGTARFNAISLPRDRHSHQPIIRSDVEEFASVAPPSRKHASPH
jgi:hypothetical protein